MAVQFQTDLASVSEARVDRERDYDVDGLLTVDDVAELLKVSKNWVYEHTRSRGTPRSERLPYIKVGKYLRFEARAVRAFLEKKCRGT
jgi:excisionase family DNA binding protein